MLLIDIHQLKIVFGQSVALAGLELEVQHIWGVLGLEGKNIVVLGSTEDLGEGTEVDTERNVAIATVWGETLGLEHHGDERDVGVVHGLQSNAGVVAVEVAVLDEVLDRIDNL